MLTSRWSGPRISFGFTNCPICKVFPPLVISSFSLLFPQHICYCHKSYNVSAMTKHYLGLFPPTISYSHPKHIVPTNHHLVLFRSINSLPGEDGPPCSQQSLGPRSGELSAFQPSTMPFLFAPTGALFRY